MLLTNSLAAQNLVPNPSFEEYLSDSCLIVQNKEDFKSLIENWTMPTNGTADIYNNIHEVSCRRHPNSTNNLTLGNQFPRSGDLMAGIFTYRQIRGPYREYIQVELLSPLVEGQQYIAGMYVSLADSMQFAANNLGMYFSDQAIDLDTFGVIEGKPPVNAETIITERSEWTLVTGTFRASAAATHLLIGNFLSDQATDTVRVRNAGNFTTAYAYYFIDDVFVEPLPDDLFIPTVFTPNGDGTNDLFVIPNLNRDSWSLSIYNRWGKRVYFSAAYDNTWDSSDLTPGVYFYHLKHRRFPYEYQGKVSLLTKTNHH